MSLEGKLEESSILFSQGSHHRNVTVVYRLENVFDNAKVQKIISLNSAYIVLFKKPREEGQMRSLAQQVFPPKSKFSWIPSERPIR